MEWVLGKVEHVFPNIFQMELGAGGEKKKKVANRNRMESAVANKFMTSLLFALPGFQEPLLASLSVERRRLVESGATSLFKGSLIASGATSKGHRGSRQLLRRRKVPQTET